MSEETQPLMDQSGDGDVSMESAPEPSPRDLALEAFKKKLTDHREYDNKLKNCMYSMFPHGNSLTEQYEWTYVVWIKSFSRRKTT